MTTVYDDLGDQDTGEVPMRRIRFTINGVKKVAEVEPRLLLAHLIRQGLGLTGTHMGCDTTNCGACTVLVDGKAIKSCTMLAVQADGHEITTVEGLATASGSRTTGSSAARATTPTTSCCPACCTWRSCAAPWRTPGSSRSTPAGRGGSPACTWCSPAR